MPANRTDPPCTKGKFIEIGFAQDDRASFLKLAHDCCLSAGYKPLEAQGATGGWQVIGGDRILDEDRNAMQRAGHPGLAEQGIQTICVFSCFWIDLDDCIDGGASLVIGLDPPEVVFKDLACRYLARLHGLVNIRNAGFLQRESKGRGDRGCH